MGHFQMECDKWCMAPSNPNHCLFRFETLSWGRENPSLTVYCHRLVITYFILSQIGHHLLYTVTDWSSLTVYCYRLVITYCILSQIGHHLVYTVTDWSSLTVYCHRLVITYSILSQIGHHLLYTVTDWSSLTVYCHRLAECKFVFYSYIFFFSI